MATQCPLCGSKLSWWNLKGSFPCPSCGKTLKANISGSWVVTVVLWSLADFPLRAAFPAPDGIIGFGFVVARSLVSLGIGYVIGSLVFRLFTTVSEG